MNVGDLKNIYFYKDNELYSFKENEFVDLALLDLCKDEFLHSLEINEKMKSDINSSIKYIGFEWDVLAETGHMRFRPYAVTMFEAMRQYAWKIVDVFCRQNNIPVSKIFGGELYSYGNEDMKRHAEAAKNSGMYGNELLEVNGGVQKQLLRFSACSNKLAVLKTLTLTALDFPMGIFEVSKSYRYENLESLMLCERVRSFHLPETHIVTMSINDSLDILCRADSYIDNHISGLGYDFVRMCTTTQRFIKEHDALLKVLATESKHPLLIVLEDGNTCENGVVFDIEYKALTSYGSWLEIATLQLDVGDSDYSYDVRCDGKPIFTIHAVFFASIERAVYSLIERCFLETTDLKRNILPMWIAPVQCRVLLDEIADDTNLKKIIKVLEKYNIRFEVDDRNISLDNKLKDAQKILIPYILVITNEKIIDYSHEKRECLVIENFESLLCDNKQDIQVQQYYPKNMSQHVV